MPKILLISLGCDKNRVDSEKMLHLLDLEGYEVTDDETEADVIIINSCCFINAAKQESIDTILEMARQKESGCCKALIVCGCMAQRYEKEIRESLPEVDACVGTGGIAKIEEVIKDALGGKKDTVNEDVNSLPLEDGGRILTTGGHYAYLMIAEGCDKHCPYCAIPMGRGRYRSVPRESLLKEAQSLADQGVKELILVAEETTLYGTDLYGRKCLHELIHDLAEIRGIRWIRVLYCYPEEIYEDLISCMKTEKKFVHYLDLPIQHADDSILKRMGRHTTNADLRRIIAHLREEVPDIVLRTTLITGFPGETEDQHEELCRFINEMEFNRLGVFTYSQEEGTPAAKMDGQIDEETKLNRLDELMSLQQEISSDILQKTVGREIECMIEGQAAGENVYVARSYGDAPDVDGYIFINTDENLMTGDFARVRITAASDYDLTGELV